MLDHWPMYIVFLVFFLFVSFGLFVLINNRAARGAQYALAGLFFCLALSVIDVSMLVSGGYMSAVHLAFWLGFVGFAYGPLIFLFTRTVLYTDRRMVNKDFLHFIPVIAYLLCVAILYLPKNIAEKKEIYVQMMEQQTWQDLVISISSFLSIAIYLFLSYMLYKQYGSRLRDQFSRLEDKRFGWVQHVLFGFIALVLISIVLQVINSLFDSSDLFRPMAIVSLCFMLVFIMTSIYRGLKYDVSFEGISAQVAQSLENKPKMELTQKERELLTQLKSVMEGEQLFLEPDVNLHTLANKMDLPDRQVSKLLNSGLNQSFFDFINAYRIKHVQSLLKEQPEMTIMEIMYRAGFNSKSSFNTAFKKHTGLTPSKYRKSI